MSEAEFDTIRYYVTYHESYNLMSMWSNTSISLKGSVNIYKLINKLTNSLQTCECTIRNGNVYCVHG